MEKKERKNFIDNVLYKNRFQFLLWVNDNVILQRYFKINGFEEESVYTEEFSYCMEQAVKLIKNDLVSKSRTFSWYTNPHSTVKLTGFVNNISERSHDDVAILTDENIRGSVNISDMTINKTYIDYSEGDINEYNEKTNTDEKHVFRFTFLIDDKIVFETAWDGNIYPRYVRNGVDLNNSLSNNPDIQNNNPFQYLAYQLQAGKENVIMNIIRVICDTLSNTYTSQYDYTFEMGPFVTSSLNQKKYKDTVKVFGKPIKVEVVGHTDIKEEVKNYKYIPTGLEFERDWEKVTKNKTGEYFEKLFPSMREIKFIDKFY